MDATSKVTMKLQIQLPSSSPTGAFLLRILVTTFLCVFFGQAQTAFSQQEGQRPAITHQQLKEEDLRAPGQKISLKLALSGTRRFDYTLRALINRDGNFMDVMIPEGTLSIYDIPEYSLSVHAPRNYIEYQFFLYDVDGSIVASSPEFQANRTCSPALDISDYLDSTPENTERDVRTLAMEAAVYERQLLAFQEAIELLDHLDETLNQATRSTAKSDQEAKR
jgi:hypothetical protein